MIIRKHLSEPWFSLIMVGKKTVEGRLNKGDFKNIEVGNIIEFYNEDFGYKRVLKVEIMSKYIYKDFKDYLSSETLKKALPSVNTINNGKNIYYKYYTKDDEKKYGVVAIRFKLI